MPPAQINFVRGAVGAILLLPLMRKEIPLLLDKRYLSLWTRSLFGSLAALALFHNIQVNGATFASAIANLSSIFVVVFSLVIFRETLTLIEWIGLGVVFAAVYTLESPLGFTIEPFAAVIGLVGAFCGGIAMTSLKRAANQFSPLLIVWGFSLFSMITALIVPSGEWSWHWKESLIVLIPVGLLGLIGQVFLTRSYQHLPAIVASACGLSIVFWNIFLEAVYFVTLPKSGSLLSYFFLCGGLLLMQGVRVRKKNSLPN